MVKNTYSLIAKKKKKIGFNLLVVVLSNIGTNVLTPAQRIDKHNQGTSTTKRWKRTPQNLKSSMESHYISLIASYIFEEDETKTIPNGKQGE